MSDDQETRDFDDGSADESEFTLEAVDGIWQQLTSDRTDPTLTFESQGQTPSLDAHYEVPTRRLSTDDSLVADYNIGSKIGEGGMGVVFDANQAALDRTVAIKMLKTENRTEAQRDKFLAEAMLTGSLQHPNIIALHDLAIDQQGNLFYSMKKINGEPWSKTIHAKSLEENLEIFLRICNAIAFAHSRNVIHRDIKPGNVMLGEFGEVLLMDWGLAVSLPTERKLESHEFPGLGGTPAYMAPELARGEFEKLGPESDVYLLGAILYEIITGSPPHVGESVVDVLLKAANNEILPTKKRGELLTISIQAMAGEPNYRFSSAMDLRTTIRSFQTHSQSMGLTRRAKRLAKRAHQNTDYNMFIIAISTFQEAIDIWAENKKAINGLVLTRKYYTEAAINNGDLDLAASILEGNDSIDRVDGDYAESLSRKISQLKEDRVSKEKQRERKIRDLDKWVNAFNGSPDLVAISRLRDGLIYEVNEAFIKTLGFSSSEVIGKNSHQINIWDDPQHRNRFVYMLESCGRCDEMETKIRKKNGQLIPVSISACVLGFDGETAVITHAHDITKRKKMERDLQQSEMRLMETQELAKLGTWEFDLDSEAISWSDETFRIVGLSKEDGEPSLEGFLSTLHPDDMPNMLTSINAAQIDGKPYRMEVRHRQADGKYKTVLATGKPKFENGRIRLIFGSVMDITEFRRP